jgi:hypothetical protein
MVSDDFEEFLKMDLVEFDQDESGWRSLVGKADENKIAELILKYIKLSGDKIDEYNIGKTGKEIFPVGLLFFHAGQSFGYAGIEYYQNAIECFRKSYDESNECWNAYVNGTIAFLSGDAEEVKRQIKFVEDSNDERKGGGNINILRSFSRCLELGIKEYSKAYEA